VKAYRLPRFSKLQNARTVHLPDARMRRSITDFKGGR
jgi:hypothetical protein